MIRLAILSDLHFGDKARRFDLQPGKGPRWDTEKGYLEEFREFLRATPAARADYVVIPGDIANSGDPAEYKTAMDFVQGVLDEMGLDFEKLFLIPGNHDVSWPVQKLGDFWRTKKFLPVKELLFHAVAHPGNQADGRLFCDPFARVIETSEIVIAQVNSAFECDHDKKPSYGMISPASLTHLRERLASISDNRPTLLVVHHHILPTSDPDPYWKDFSAAQNSEALIELIQELGIDLVVHGHKHWPKLRVQSSVPGNPYVVFGAGSFSAQIDESISGIVFNKFHVLEVHGRDDKQHCAGQLLSWSYHGGESWQPSEAKHGIAHKRPFGFYVDDQTLLKHLEAGLKPALSSTGHAALSDVLAAIPNVAYVEKGRIDRLIAKTSFGDKIRLVHDDATGVDYVLHL